MAPKKFYAVRKGFKTGIFNTWSECKKLVLGCGDACGNNSAIEACNNAMGNIDFTNVKSIIINVIASCNLSLSEVNRAIEAIREKNKDIELIFGAGVDDSYGDKLEIRIIGFK